jgi:O-antigen/teichoic acid export membrane protein
VRAIGDFLRCLFLAAGRPGFDATCNWVGAVVCAAGYFLLIPPYGMWGAAYATAAAFFAIGVISVVWTYRLRRYRVEAGRLIKIGLALAAALTSYGLLPGFALPGQIASAALSVAIFALSLWLLRFPTGGELQIAGAAIQSLRRYNRA